MDWLEQELRSALARKEPPPGFADEVAGELAGGARTVVAWPSRVTGRWLAAAAAIILIIGGGVGYRRHRGIEAKRQVMQAFAIAGGKLNHLQEHLKEVSQ
jgi:hypothetical protein